jgi:hypothetical protein
LQASTLKLATKRKREKSLMTKGLLRSTSEKQRSHNPSCKPLSRMPALDYFILVTLATAIKPFGLRDSNTR